MGLWFLVCFCALLIPATMILFGRYFMIKAPVKINCFFGYRTKRSMRNRSSWEFAHRFFGRLWWRVGWLLLFLSILFCFFIRNADTELLGRLTPVLMFAQMPFLLFPIYLTEKALKKEFET